MKNFQLLAVGLDVLPLRMALHRKDHLFGALEYRTAYEGSPHAKVKDILLRFSNHKEFELLNSDPESPDQPPYGELPEARPLVNWLVARVQAERIGRVMITKLAPFDEIGKHADPGRPTDYCGYYDRFHIVIQSMQGMTFNCDDEQVQMQTGEAWWFDNKKFHSVTNGGTVERIHMIVDLRLRQ